VTFTEVAVDEVERILFGDGISRTGVSVKVGAVEPCDFYMSPDSEVRGRILYVGGVATA
jgi:hypothetical protein